MTPVFNRSFPVSVAGIGAIDSWIESAGDEWGLPERTVFATRLCVAELAGNVFEHGIPRFEPDQIEITLQPARDGVAVVFQDWRQAFDPTAATLPPKPGSYAGGRGLKLVKAYATDIAYSNDGTSNRLSFKIVARAEQNRHEAAAQLPNG